MLRGRHQLYCCLKQQQQQVGDVDSDATKVKQLPRQVSSQQHLASTSAARDAIRYNSAPAAAAAKAATDANVSLAGACDCCAAAAAGVVAEEAAGISYPFDCSTAGCKWPCSAECYLFCQH